MEERIAALEKQTAALTQYVKEVQESNKSIATGFDKVDSNFEKITAHFNKIEKELILINYKIDNLDGSTSNSLNKVDIKLDDLKTEIQKINNITGYEDIYQNLKVIKG